MFYQRFVNWIKGSVIIDFYTEHNLTSINRQLKKSFFLFLSIWRTAALMVLPLPNMDLQKYKHRYSFWGKLQKQAFYCLCLLQRFKSYVSYCSMIFHFVLCNHMFHVSIHYHRSVFKLGMHLNTINRNTIGLYNYWIELRTKE